MTKIAKIIVFCVLLTGVCLNAGAQRKGYVISARNAETAVSEKYVRDAVSYLSAESLGGRASGSPGGAAAANWISLQFKETGLETVGATYLYGFRNSGVLCRNVIGVLPGTGSRAVIVMAHFDNYGKLGDTFFPGADSNASGVAALLQVARMFRRMRDYHKDYGTTLVFVALDAKEKDLAGASELWNMIKGGKLGFAPSDITLVVNLDQLGSTLSPLTKGNPDYLMMLSEENGGRRSTLMSVEKTQRIGLELAFDYYGSKDFTMLFYRKISDQKIFLENGIPAVMFTSGITMLNNKPGDTPDTLDYGVLMKRIRLIFYYLERIL